MNTVTGQRKFASDSIALADAADRVIMLDYPRKLPPDIEVPEMSNSPESKAVTLSIPYRYDVSAGRDSGVSYFVDNDFHQGILGIQNGGTANHQCFSVHNAEAGVSSKYGSDILT